jgi:hypothetical protein
MVLLLRPAAGMLNMLEVGIDILWLKEDGIMGLYPGFMSIAAVGSMPACAV